MRYFFICCLLLLQIVARAQVLYPYKDSTDNYVIGLPEKWTYWRITNVPNLSMMAKNVSHLKDSAQTVYPDNLNVTIVQQQGINVDSALYYLVAATSHSRLQVLDTGSYMVFGKKELWFDDVHIGGPKNDTLSSSCFVVYSNGKAYIITCTTTAARFSGIRELFHRVAQTFKTDLPGKQELVQITYPQDRKWKILLEQDDSMMHFKQVLPLDESADRWTTVLSFITEKMTGNEPLASVLARYSTLLKRAACEHPKYSVLSQSETSALFKIECDGDKTESNLCYLVRGATRWH